MKSEALSMHQEIRNIAKLQGLIYSRYLLLCTCMLCMLYYLAHRYGLYCFYPFALSLITPTLIELRQKKGLHNATVLLPVLREQYHYSKLRHVSLSVAFWLCNILLISWYFRLIYSSSANWLANHIPLFLLLENLLCYLGITYYYQFKFHYQLINNRW